MKPEGLTSLASTIEALRAGDVTAFEHLYQVFEPRLYAFALHLVRQREDAEEVVQEVFLKVWERRHQLDPEQNFDGYLFSIAKNLVYNKARSKATEFAFTQYIMVNGKHAGCFTEEAVAYKDLSKLLDDTCAALPPVRRQVFIMSRVEGKSNREIAQQLNTTSSNIENHLYKALKVIRKIFTRYEAL
ncbi:hypothetical protein OB13_14570 [Pontibacter sp. HJ8]